MAARSDRILIIDDDPNLLELLSAQLEASGFQPFTSLGGEDILNLLDRVRPDLLILDLMLPKVSGFEVLAIIRSMPAWKTLSIIILSAMGDESSMVKGLKLGAQDYISKPFRRQELIARIERNLEMKHYEEMLNIRNRQLETLLGNLDIILRQISPSLKESEEARLILGEIVKALPQCDVTAFVLDFSGLIEVHLTLHAAMSDESRHEVSRLIAEEYHHLSGQGPSGAGEKPLTFVSDDPRTDPTRVVAASELQSRITVPLKRHDHLIGMLYLASSMEAAFSEGDVYFAYALAGQTQSFMDKEREKERTRDDFLALVAHDLRSPVTSVMAYCHLLEKGEKLTDEQRCEFLQTVMDINRYQMFIIDNIAIIPQVESDDVPLERIIIPLNVIFERMQEIFGSALRFRGSTLAAEMEPRLRVVGDARLIERCVANIIASIAESTKKATIFFRARKEHDSIVVSLGSPSIFLDAGAVESLFHKYKEGRAPLVRGERGLGLYIARKILHRHGGDIEVVSTKEEGTTFTFTLPEAPEDGII